MVLVQIQKEREKRVFKIRRKKRKVLTSPYGKQEKMETMKRKTKRRQNNNKRKQKKTTRKRKQRINKHTNNIQTHKPAVLHPIPAARLCIPKLFRSRRDSYRNAKRKRHHSRRYSRQHRLIASGVACSLCCLQRSGNCFGPESPSSLHQHAALRDLRRLLTLFC